MKNRGETAPSAKISFASKRRRRKKKRRAVSAPLTLWIGTTFNLPLEGGGDAAEIANLCFKGYVELGRNEEKRGTGLIVMIKLSNAMLNSL